MSKNARRRRRDTPESRLIAKITWGIFGVVVVLCLL